MDPLDYASETAQQFNDSSIKQVRDQVGSRLPAVGQCYYCQEYVDNHLRFCDVECRDDWEMEQKQRKASGGRHY